MLKKGLLSLLLLIFSLNFAFSQLTIRLTAIPANTPPNADIYIAGNFNNWNPNKDKLLKQNDGSYVIAINANAGALEYKFTRGSWATVEGTAQSTFRPNRKIQYNGGLQVTEHKIDGWEDGGNGKQHTATTNVRIIEEQFVMPQLNRKRRIWIYLPQDYLTNPTKRYNVMYMQDGQNLFDKYFSFGEEWQIDETLNRLFDQNSDEGCIVVGIDNGGASRIGEYTPYVNQNHGGGEGDKYMMFIINTLKPYIDQNFRTKPTREHTAIGGSSLGGLISFYIGMKNQDIFSRILAFSPSFWWHSNIYKMVENEGKQQTMKIFLMAGGNEEPDDDVVTKTKKMYDALQDEGFTKNEVFFATHNDGTHSEWYWAREFAPSYGWLWSNLVHTENVERENDFSFYPNPAEDYIRISIPNEFSKIKVEIRDVKSKVVLKSTVHQGDSINVASLPKGVYMIDFKDGKQTLRTQRIIKL